MIRSRYFLAFALCLSIWSTQAQENEQAKLKTFHSISSHDLLNYVSELSSEKYKGRLSGSPGYLAAANWVADQLKQSGIKPGAGDTYFQWFPNAYTDVLTSGSVTLLKGANNPEKKYKFPDDYFPGSNSASGTVSGEVVYCGFGVSAPELGYDDYANIDVKGKIVLIESGLPYTKNDSTLLKWQKFSHHKYKFQQAKDRGAIGLVYVGLTANPNTAYMKDFVYVHISEKVADDLFAGTGHQYAEMKKGLTKEQHPNSFSLNKKLRISASTKHFPESQSCNVVGLIEGSDPTLKDEAIILGAHLDAVGSPGCVFPGALDNGSGSSDILAAAKALASSEIKPARSVLIIFFGGEECGLYGSTKAVESPLWTKDKVVCMINLDMVGNGTGFNFANGKTFPELLRPFEEANKQYIHREMVSTVAQPNFGRARTDGAVFEKDGYKTLGLWTTGTVKPVYYHQPLDNTYGLTPEIMEDAAKMLYLGILELASEKEIK